MQNHVKVETCPRLNYQVNVVRHDAPRKEVIPFIVKVQNRRFHDFGNLGLAHQAVTPPLIQTLINRSAELNHPPSIFVGFGNFGGQQSAFLHQMADPVLWQAVG